MSSSLDQDSKGRVRQDREERVRQSSQDRVRLDVEERVRLDGEELLHQDGDERLRQDLQAIFMAGIQAVLPEQALPRHVRFEGGQLLVGRRSFDLSSFNRVRLLGAGKGAAAMAAVMEGMLGDRLTDGLVVVKYGHGQNLSRTAVLESGHPVPDQAGERAAQQVLDFAESCGELDLVICLISGGASALTPLPVQGLSLEHKQEATRQLLACGAGIHEINTLRKHLSRIKGGRLAQALAPAAVCCLVVSDVVGDDLDVIGSGMIAPDSSSFADCLEIIRRHGLENTMPDVVLRHLGKGLADPSMENPGPQDSCFGKVSHQLVTHIGQALEAAASAARDLGFEPMILTSRMCGEAREVAQVLAAVAADTALDRRPVHVPACVLAGGESTVTIRGQGKGGRNQEMALALALALEPYHTQGCAIAGVCVGTDGTDGPTDAAGALVLPDTLVRGRGMGLDPAAMLRDNDSHSFFHLLGDLIVTGPTRTNVMDMVLLLIY